RRLSSADVALIASMNVAEVRVARRPRVALLATGDELVMPGEAPAPDQIIASNTFGLAAMIEAEGGIAQVLPIARDREDSLLAALSLTKGSDLLVTIGGASVGDHDLVGKVALSKGMERSFYKVAMRPGKPLMAGMLDAMPMVGLPGNPVSSMVCGHVFLRPALRALQGLPAAALEQKNVPLAAPIGKNGPREHYMRASLMNDEITAADRQDSALMSVLTTANALIVRPPNDPPRDTGDLVSFIEL
ncbi:MAG: molybdopterin molybdotransferase MoeA, partial [Paracoccaceae bacterium]